MQLKLTAEDMRAAIAGYQMTIAAHTARVSELETRLQGDDDEDDDPVPDDPAEPQGKRVMSKAGRKRLSLAMKKRWRRWHRLKKIEAKGKVRQIRRAAA